MPRTNALARLFPDLIHRHWLGALLRPGTSQSHLPTLKRSANIRLWQRVRPSSASAPIAALPLLRFAVNSSLS
jgi:hypothetical protein